MDERFHRTIEAPERYAENVEVSASNGFLRVHLGDDKIPVNREEVDEFVLAVIEARLRMDY